MKRSAKLRGHTVLQEQQANDVGDTREAEECRRRALEGFSVPVAAEALTFRGPIIALGRVAAREVLCAPISPRPAALIAIVGRGWSSPQSFHSPKGIQILRLIFNDIVVADSGFPEAVLFDEIHREKILRFVNRLSEETTLIVHCLHGHSRSRAVVAALRRLRGDDDIIEWLDGEPNEHVYRTMLGAKRPILGTQ